MKRFLSVLLVLIFVNVGYAQSIKLPDKVIVKVNRLTPVVVDYDGDDIAFTTDGEADVFREYSKDNKVRLRVVLYKSGTAKLKVIVCKDKSLSEFYTCTITDGQNPPNPDDPVDPDDPSDPLFTALKSAWDKETSFTKKTERDKLAAIYEAAVDLVKKPVDKTQGELIARIAAAAKKDVGDPTKVLPEIRKVIQQYFNSMLTTKTSDPIDPKSADAFKAVAKSLEALK